MGEEDPSWEQDCSPSEVKAAEVEEEEEVEVGVEEGRRVEEAGVDDCRMVVEVWKVEEIFYRSFLWRSDWMLFVLEDCSCEADNADDDDDGD